MTGRAAGILAAAALALAVGGQAPTAAGAPGATASVSPASLWIGDVAVVRLRIDAPAGARVLRAAPPVPPAGFEVTAGPTVRETSDAALELTYSLRALRAGAWDWPATRVEIADPEGRTRALTTAPVAVEVRSILGEFPGRTAPFGARDAPPPPASAPAVPAVAALLLGGAVVALGLALWRRRRRAPAPVAVPPWARARDGLGRAREAAASDAIRAADTAAAALRGYMIGRFGAKAAAATTEELSASTPPFAATSRWPDFVGLMRELDTLRFGGTEGVRQRATALQLVGRAEHFVEGSLPPEALR